MKSADPHADLIVDGDNSRMLRSGARLRPIAEQLIRTVKQEYPDVHIIVGGGIYRPRDVESYALAGAEYFSLATIWLSPWRVPGMLAAH